MAGLKRKDAPLANTHTNSVHKKPRKAAAQSKIIEDKSSTLEAETDSDPIVESDTTEHSGDDDGASWPSDEEEDDSQPSSKDERSTNKLTREDRSVKKPAGTDDNNGEIDQGNYCSRNTADLSNSQLFQGISCKAKGPGSGAQSGQAERGLDSSNQENLGTPTQKITCSSC